jgi:hypothetical protein
LKQAPRVWYSRLGGKLHEHLNLNLNQRSLKI